MGQFIFRYKKKKIEKFQRYEKPWMQEFFDLPNDGNDKISVTDILAVRCSLNIISIAH